MHDHAARATLGRRGAIGVKASQKAGDEGSVSETVAATVAEPVTVSVAVSVTMAVTVPGHAANPPHRDVPGTQLCWYD